MIGILGSKGGVGKSIFAANFAIAVQNELKAKTLLIDLDSKTCGDQNVILGIRPEKSIADLCKHSSALTPLAFKSYVTTHASGIDYLAALTDPTSEMSIDEDVFAKSLQTFSQFYKFIIVDLGNQLGPLQFKIIDDISSGLIVTTPDILTVTQTKKLLNELVTATYPAEIFQIVVNKAHTSGLSPKAIGDSLKRPVLSAIPQDDALVYASLANGTPFCYSNPRHPVSMAHHEVIRKLTGGVLQKLKALSQSSVGKKQTSTGGSSSDKAAAGTKKISDHLQLKIQIHNELIKETDLKKDIFSTKGDAEKEKQLEQKTQKIITMLIDKYAPGLSREVRTQTIKEVLDESLKLGPLEELLADNSVTEIMVNGCEKIFVEKSGRVVLSPSRFTSNLQLRNIIERIVTPLGRRIDERTPYVDARLMDGSRVNAVIEPLAIDGPALTIRKFSKETITYENYLQWGSMSKSMVDFLRICVEQGLNIVISGGTGSGKTTLLNTMSSFIPSDERIVTVEDAAELQMKQEHVVRLETRPAGMDGSNAITIRDLVRNSLRMRPDRIVVGECRDGAALDMLQAMNTGHDGSMTTVHANNAKEAIGRLETLCLMAGMDLPMRAIREQIASAVNLIVQIGRLSDGSRKIKSITEVVGMQGDIVTLQEVFKFKEEGFDKKRKIIGSFQATGLVPTFIEKFEARGVQIPRSIFSNEKPAENLNANKGVMPLRKKIAVPDKASGDQE
jgi:pilus assembly protein CpaF